MSFLDSVLTSLETGKPSPLPVSQPPSPPSLPSVPAKVPAKGSGNSVQTPTAGSNKRKAHELSRPDVKPAMKPAAKPSMKPAAKPSKKPAAKPAPKPAAKPAPKPAAKPAPKPAPKPASKPAAPAKPAPKGSYADIMAQAQAMQAMRAQLPNKVGVIGHKKTETKYTHREYQHLLKEAKRRARAEKAGRVFKPEPPPGEAMRRKFASTSPESSSRKSTPEVPIYQGTAKKTIQTPEAPSYRGTAGLPGRNGTNDRRHNAKRRKNEYLGTDEEDEGDDYGGYDDYQSDASSDMEAGFDDVEQEDRRALNNARKEDEEEARLELLAKKEKIARQQRLAALASRKR